MSNFTKVLSVLALVCSLSGTSFAKDSIELNMPVQCILGEDCFLQQMPDMDAGPESRDPFGGMATYDDHKGTDVRVRYLSDIDKNVPVLASLSGTVLRVRDGVEDRLVRTEQERQSVKNIECGNGIVVAHENGWETQYCHLKNGSIKVERGQEIQIGDVIGYVGASGMAAFAHVHIGLRHKGDVIDPFTGQALLTMKAPNAKTGRDLWAEDTIVAMGGQPTQIMDMGISDGIVDHSQLAERRPKNADTNSGAYVGWVSVINLQKGDVVQVSLTGPGIETPIINKIEPLDRSKASYSLYAGKRGTPQSGIYEVSVDILREGAILLTQTESIEMR